MPQCATQRDGFQNRKWSRLSIGLWINGRCRDPHIFPWPNCIPSESPTLALYIPGLLHDCLTNPSLQAADLRRHYSFSSCLILIKASPPTFETMFDSANSPGTS